MASQGEKAIEGREGFLEKRAQGANVESGALLRETVQASHALRRFFDGWFWRGGSELADRRLAGA
jgi:hypothetical protein